MSFDVSMVWWGLLGFVIVGGLPLLVLAVWSWAGSSRQRNKWQPPAYGFETFEGKPGSGKSFICTMKLIESMLRDKRPVYTNLPLKFRVVRQYLRVKGREQFAAEHIGVDGEAGRVMAGAREYGDLLAGLLHELQEQHFRNFMERQHELMQFRNRLKAKARASGTHVNEAAIREAFAVEHGPFVCDSTIDTETGDMVYGNWVPTNSIICIDEVHHWFPMSEQASEKRYLLDYASMVRHHLHWVWLATQDRMQMNKRLRDMTQWFWHVRNRGDDRLVAGLKFSSLGIKAFGYARMSVEAEAARASADRQPSEQFNVFYWMPKYSWVFRCYDSFTHQGGSRRMRSELRESREAVGLDEEGRPRSVESAADRVARSASRKEQEVIRMRGFIGVMVRSILIAACGWFAGILSAPAVAAYLAAAVGSPAPPVASAGTGAAAVVAESPGAGGAAGAAGDVASSPVREAPVFPFRKLEAVVADGAVADGRSFKVGRQSGETLLLRCEPESGASMWGHGDGVWMWRAGERPEYLGSARDVFFRLRALAVVAERAGRGESAVVGGSEPDFVAGSESQPPG